ncbi:MAG: glycosidase, partial [Bacteroidota bacterium]
MLSVNDIKKIKNYDLLTKAHKDLLRKKNVPLAENNGVFHRYKNPIITAAHTPLHWRYDLNSKTNPNGLERIGINAAFNAGAIKWNGKYLLMVRVEGNDRKSFFAFAESTNGLDNFEFWDQPFLL